MKFTPGAPIDTPKPTVIVDKGLAVGPHRFQLVVVNPAGKSSKPTEVVVTIVAST